MTKHLEAGSWESIYRETDKKSNRRKNKIAKGNLLLKKGYTEKSFFSQVQFGTEKKNEFLSVNRVKTI